MARRRAIAGILVALAALGCADAANGQSSAPVNELNITDATAVVEGNSGQKTVTFTVTRSNPAGTLRYGYGTCCTTGGDEGVDHDVAFGNIFMGAGDTSDTITVNTTGDTQVEPDTVFGVKISAIENATIGRDTGFARIIDDDGRPAGTVIDVGDPAPVGELGPGETRNVVFPLTLSNAGTVPMTIHYSTVDGTAAGGDDYTAASGDVTFAPGERNKSVTVTVVGDDTFEADEDFRLVLSNPTAAGPGREGTAVILNDDEEPPPPPPPPPGPPAERTLLGLAYYQPAFGVGFKGLEVLGPFAALPRPRALSVRLVGPDGAVIREQRLTGEAGIAAGTSPVPYRFDGLLGCDSCTLQLFGDSTLQDSVTVSYDGEAGQTDVDLQYGRPGQGAVLEGTVLAPAGAQASEMTVEILDAAGKVIGDTAKAPFKCKTSGACPVADSYEYRLTGLPSGAIPVRAVLMQGSGAKRGVAVDSVDLTLDPSGMTVAPDLTAVYDPPAGASGRTVYGQINNRSPFGPGEYKPKELAVSERALSDFRVQLRKANGDIVQQVREFTPGRSGYVGYQLTKVDDCNDCSIVLVQDKKVLDRGAVTIPKTTPSVVRRDLDYSRGDPEFATGDVLAVESRGTRLAVTLVDPATGATLARTPDGSASCGGNSRCPIGSPLPYRLDGVPPDRDVIARVQSGNKVLNQRRIRTAPAGETTQIPALALPLGKGPRSIQGKILNAGPFAPGRSAADFTKGLDVDTRLLDSTGAQVALVRSRVFIPDGNAKRDFFVLDNLPPCTGCVLELSTKNQLEDRVPIDVPDDSPTVGVADMSWRAISGGAYVQGKLVVRSRSYRPSDLIVQVLSSTNKVLVDSSKLPDLKQQPADADSYAYRLGGIPRDAGKVKIVVLTGKKKRVANTTVTIAPGTADTTVPDLKIDR